MDAPAALSTSEGAVLNMDSLLPRPPVRCGEFMYQIVRPDALHYLTDGRGSPGLMRIDAQDMAVAEAVPL